MKYSQENTPNEMDYSYNYKGCLVIVWGNETEVYPPIQYVKFVDDKILLPVNISMEEVKMFIDLMFA